MSDGRKVVVKILMYGRWGGEVVEPNTDFETGGYVHPDTQEQIDEIKVEANAKRLDPPKGLPDAAYRDTSVEQGERFVGDLVKYDVGTAIGLMRKSIVGFTDGQFASKPAEIKAFLKELFASSDSTPDYPVFAQPRKRSAGKEDD